MSRLITTQQFDELDTVKAVEHCVSLTREIDHLMMPDDESDEWRDALANWFWGLREVFLAADRWQKAQEANQ